MEAAESIIKRENLRSFKGLERNIRKTPLNVGDTLDRNRGRLQNTDGEVPQQKMMRDKEDSWRYYIRDENAKISADDYFLRRSTLPFQSLNSEVTQMSSICHETSNKSRKTDACQTQILDPPSGGLQERITKALEDFNGSIHAIVPLVSIDEHHPSIGADIASGVFTYCAKMTQNRTKSLIDCSNEACSDRQKLRRDCAFGKTFDVNEQTPVNTISKKYEDIFDVLFTKADPDPMFCSTPAEGRILTATKKSKRAARVEAPRSQTVHFQESQTQVLSTIRNNIMVGHLSRREATFVKTKNPGIIVHPMKQENDENHFELPSSNNGQQALQVVININNPFASSSSEASTRRKNSATFACVPTNNVSTMYANHNHNSRNPAAKISFQVSGSVTLN